MKTLDEGTFACGTFADLQKAFASVGHKKIDYYGISGISYK